MLGSISNLDYCNLQSKSLYLFTNTSCIKQMCRLQIQSAEISRTDMQFQKQFKIYILNYILPVNITTLLQQVYYVYNLTFISSKSKPALIAKNSK